MIKEINISSSKKCELIDITEDVKEIVEQSEVKEGMCHVYVPHATCGVVINENNDPNICEDFADALNRLIPEGIWRHDKIDNNAAAHIKSSIVGPSESIPIIAGKLALGMWQNIMVSDFDGPRSSRRVIISITD